MINIEKELARRLMDEGNAEGRLEAYSREINFYELVSSGNSRALEERLKNFGAGQVLGRLSNDAVQDRKYHAVILVALVSRFCIEQGMEISVAYTLSDIYIELIDNASTGEEVRQLQMDLLRHYCRKMNDLTKSKVVSRHIVIADRKSVV